MLPKHHRIRASHEYGAVLRGSRRAGARRARTPLLLVHAADVRAREQPARVGFIVSAVVGNSVIRHRVTRRLRAMMSSRIHSWPGGTDLVVRATPGCAQASYDDLASDLDQALTRVSP